MKSNKVDWDSKAQERRTAKHPIVQFYAQSRIDLIKQYIDPSEVDQVLELGAGDGFFSLCLARDFKHIAADISRKMLEKNPVDSQKIILNILEDNTGDLNCDVVFEANVLHHTDDERMFLQKMSEISNRYIVIIEPNPLNPLTFILAMILPHERKSLWFTKRYMKQLARKEGLDVVFMESFGMAPPNRCPSFLWPFFRFFERKISLFGLENIVVLKKNNFSDQ